jgi:phenylpropionate dioxygenase-like ring-hydroxylating dioxygenase large terminal subunit
MDADPVPGRHGLSGTRARRLDHLRVRVLLVRQEDMSFRAFFNTCPHRGARVIEGTDGHAERFYCPYHAWKFDLSGTVVEAPCPHDYPQGSPRSKVGLKELRCQERFGFVWFNADPNAGSLEDFLGEAITADLEFYRIEKMVRVLNMTAEADCNWKTIIDNFNESHHVQVVHKQLASHIEADGDRCQYDAFHNGHNRGWFPSFRPASFYQEEAPQEPLITLMKEWGLDSANYRGREQLDQIRLDVQKKKRAEGPARGFKHYDHLADYQLTDYAIYNLFPNTVLTPGPDGVELLRPRPHPVDPNKCLFDHWWMVPHIEGRTMTPSPSGGPDLPVEDAELEEIRFGDKSLGETAGNYQEVRVRHLHRTLDEYLQRLGEGGRER